jgi:Flp pilus assembly protein protease CpaA
MFEPCLLSSTLVLTVLLPAGVLDYLYREVDPELWVPGLLLGLPLGAACALQHGSLALPYYAVGGVIVILVGVLFLLGFMGGADFYATLLLALVLPAPPRWSLGLPPVLVVTLYAAVLSVLHSIFIAWRASGKPVFYPRLSVSARIYLADGRFRWWIPTGAHVEELEDYIFEVAARDGTVRIAPGTPHVTHIFLALLLYLIVGGPLTMLIG